MIYLRDTKDAKWLELGSLGEGARRRDKAKGQIIQGLKGKDKELVHCL